MAVYRGKKITMVDGGRYEVEGFILPFFDLGVAKRTIDGAWAEDEALREIDRHVKEDLGGYV